MSTRSASAENHACLRFIMNVDASCLGFAARPTTSIGREYSGPEFRP
jgi:hypothetical protein